MLGIGLPDAVNRSLIDRANLPLLQALALPSEIALALSRTVISQHDAEHEILFRSQFAVRTSPERFDHINAGRMTKINIDSSILDWAEPIRHPLAKAFFFNDPLLVGKDRIKGQVTQTAAMLV